MGEAGLAAIHHGPLPRATETATIVAAYCSRVPVYGDECVGDYLPSAPDTSHLPDSYGHLVHAYRPAERVAGAAWAATAVRRFVEAPGDADTQELIITHNFLVGWLVRHVLGGPDWRWLGLNQCNAALTAILCRDGYPPVLVAFNDMSHLPESLRWTGFPDSLRA